MTTAWLLGSTSLFATTVGGLLIFLYLWKSPTEVADSLPPDAKRVYARHQKMLTLSVGLLTAWLLLQYLALILIISHLVRWLERRLGTDQSRPRE